MLKIRRAITIHFLVYWTSKRLPSGLQLNAIIQQEAVCEATERRAFDEAISYVSGYMMPFSADTLINLFNALNDRP